MRYSKHNIFSKIRDSENYFILNPLSESADILTPREAGKVELLRNGSEIDDPAFVGEMTEKGYLSDETAEQKLFRTKYLDFLDSRETDEVQIFFVTN